MQVGDNMARKRNNGSAHNRPVRNAGTYAAGVGRSTYGTRWNTSGNQAMWKQTEVTSASGTPGPAGVTMYQGPWYGPTGGRMVGGYSATSGNPTRQQTETAKVILQRQQNRNRGRRYYPTPKLPGAL